MQKAEKCISCGKGLIEKGSTTFPCPTCDEIIGRCSSCREQSVKFTCMKCGFTGISRMNLIPGVKQDYPHLAVWELRLQIWIGMVIWMLSIYST